MKYVLALSIILALTGFGMASDDESESDESESTDETCEPDVPVVCDELTLAPSLFDQFGNLSEAPTCTSDPHHFESTSPEGYTQHHERNKTTCVYSNGCILTESETETWYVTDPNGQPTTSQGRTDSETSHKEFTCIT